MENRKLKQFKKPLGQLGSRQSVSRPAVVGLRPCRSLKPIMALKATSMRPVVCAVIKQVKKESGQADSDT